MPSIEQLTAQLSAVEKERDNLKAMLSRPAGCYTSASQCEVEVESVPESLAQGMAEIVESRSLQAQLSLAESRAASVERIAQNMAVAVVRQRAACKEQHEAKVAYITAQERYGTKGEKYYAAQWRFDTARHFLCEAEDDLTAALTAYREQQKASQALENHVRQD